MATKARAASSAHEKSSRTYPRRSLHGQVAHEIGLRILRGDMATGDVLPNEADLGAELGVSRTVLREAIKMLAAKGLVVTRPKTGTRVRPRDEWSLLDPDVLSWLFQAGRGGDYVEQLFEFRMVIEPAAAALAAEKRDSGMIEAIAAAYKGMEEAGDDVLAGVDPDLRFHLGVLDASGNEFIASLGALIEAALAYSFSQVSAGDKLSSLPRHKAVLDAIVAGEAAAARAAMTVLLDEAREGVRGMMTRNASSP